MVDGGANVCVTGDIGSLLTDAFDEVDWPHVYRTLNEEVPRLFQVWACKQVMNIAATNKNLSRRHRDGRSDEYSGYE